MLARPDLPPVEISDWLAMGSPELSIDTSVCNELFANWVDEAQNDASLLVDAIASCRHVMLLARHTASHETEAARSRRWLRVRADLLCGASVRGTEDLFGAPDPDAGWRSQDDPLTRLIMFATDPEVPKVKRREANETIGIFRAMALSDAPPGPVVSRPLGMLMLVPRFAL